MTLLIHNEKRALVHEAIDEVVGARLYLLEYKIAIEVELQGGSVNNLPLSPTPNYIPFAPSDGLGVPNRGREVSFHCSTTILFLIVWGLLRRNARL